MTMSCSPHSCHHFLLASRSRIWCASEAKSCASDAIKSTLSCSVRSFSPRMGTENQKIQHLWGSKYRAAAQVCRGQACFVDTFME